MTHCGVFGKLVPPVVLLLELPALDHGAHGAVDHHDALAQQRIQLETQVCQRILESLQIKHRTLYKKQFKIQSTYSR